MGFFSDLTRSWKKSSRLHQLELRIAPLGRSTHDTFTEFMHSLDTGIDEKKLALEEFLDLCETDEGIEKVMETERLSRADLKDIYKRLMALGLGGWIKGHYAALSTIAYVEPLLYVVRSQKRGAGWEEIVLNLLQYWENKIPQGTLLKRLE